MDYGEKQLSKQMKKAQTDNGKGKTTGHEHISSPADNQNRTTRQQPGRK